MKAIDTNILVRVIAGDDEPQAATAGRVLASGAYVTSGVMIEAEWVLISFYKMARADIAAAFTRVLNIPTLTFDNRRGLLWAVERYCAGADWADMVHLVDAVGRSALVTFDVKLAKQAGPDTPVPVELLTA